MKRLTLSCLPLILLGACSSDEAGGPTAPGAEEGARADGEVLGGAISDDMIPLDEITSQPPKAGGAEGGSDSTSDETPSSETGD